MGMAMGLAYVFSIYPCAAITCQWSTTTFEGGWTYVEECCEVYEESTTRMTEWVVRGVALMEKQGIMAGKSCLAVFECAFVVKRIVRWAGVYVVPVLVIRIKRPVAGPAMHLECVYRCN